MEEPENSLRVLVVDDHAIVREGVRRILEAAAGRWAVTEACNGQEAIEALRRLTIDAAIVDLSMPGISGLDLTRRIKSEYPGTGVLMFSMHAEPQYALRAFSHGANGYLTKDSPAAVLVDAVRRVAAGRTYVTPDQAELVVHQLGNTSPRTALGTLSDREFEVLRRIAAGSTLKEIAQELCLSIKTVSTHKARILDKLHLPSTAALIRYGIEQGFSSEPLTREETAPLDEGKTAAKT